MTDDIRVSGEVVGHNLTQAAAGSYYVFVATLHLYVINTFDVQFYVNVKLLVWFGRFPAFALSGLHTWHMLILCGGSAAFGV